MPAEMKVQSAATADRVCRCHDLEQLFVYLVLQRRDGIRPRHDESRVFGSDATTVCFA